MKKIDPKKRVVVTGLGVVSSIGIGWQEFWPNLLAGKSGISKIESFDTRGYDRHYAGEIKNFDSSKFINMKRSSQMGRTSQMAITGVKLALEDARIQISELKDLPLYIGTTGGERALIESLNQNKIKKSDYMLSNVKFLTSQTDNLINSVRREIQINNLAYVFSTACSAGNYAIGAGFDKIKLGEANKVMVGGADSSSQMVFTGFCRLFAVAPEKCQPFDRNRKGMIPAEGAGFLVLESLQSAKKRKAHIYAEVLGSGMSCDARHMTNPSETGVAKAIKKCLKNSNIQFDEVDYISAHGTGTIENDRTESQAIRTVFGKSTDKLPISSIKSMLGHTMGAASAIESIACCLAIKEGKIPPTINHKEDDPECLIDCVPNKFRKHNIDIALNNSQAFGGNNACLLFRKFEL